MQSNEEDAALLRDYYTPSGKWAHMAEQVIEGIVLGAMIGSE